MTRIMIYIFAAAAAIAAAPAGGAASLKKEVTVYADVIRIGDIFASAGKAAARVVEKAPAPGARKILGARRLAAIAREAGLGWTPASRAARVVIERASRLIEPAEIEDAVSQALAAEGVSSDREVKLLHGGLKAYAAADRAEPFRIADLKYNPRTGRFSATLVIPFNARAATRTRIAGRVYTIVEVPILARQIRPDEIIGRHDVEWVRRRAETIRRNVVLDPSAIVGLTPRRLLRPGAPIRYGDLRAPVVVEKGSLVTLTFRTRNLLLTAKARAAEDGARGDTIRVINTRSRKTVEGVVVGPGRVVIQGPDLAMAATGGAR